MRKSSSAIWERVIGVWEMSQKGIELALNSIWCVFGDVGMDRRLRGQVKMTGGKIGNPQAPHWREAVRESVASAGGKRLVRYKHGVESRDPIVQCCVVRQYAGWKSDD